MKRATIKHKSPYKTLILLRKALICSMIFLLSYGHIVGPLYAEDGMINVEIPAESVVESTTEPAIVEIEQPAPVVDSVSMVIPSESLVTISENQSVSEEEYSQPSLADIQPKAVDAEEKKELFVLPSLAELLPAVITPSIVGPGTISSVDTGSVLTGSDLPDIVLIQESEVLVGNTTMAVLLKKDGDLNLKEIQVTEEVVASEHEIGITIIIPQDTKIFSPEKNETIVLDDQKADEQSLPSLKSTESIDATAPISATDISIVPVMPSVIPTPSVENLAPLSLPVIEELIPITAPVLVESIVEQPVVETSHAEELPTTPVVEVIPEETIAPVTQEVVEVAPVMPTPMLTEVIIESNFSGEIVDDLSLEGDVFSGDLLAGQGSLYSSDLVIEQGNPEGVEIVEEEFYATKVFEFGLVGQHLVFSKPIEIRINMPDSQEGDEVMLRVKHAGDDDYGTRGLTTDMSVVCDASGNASVESNSAKVQNGEIVFYTCGASEFAVGVTNPTFNPNMSSTVSAIGLRSDDNIYVGGAFVTIGGVRHTGFAMLTSTGFRITSYNVVMSGAVNALKVLPDDSVIIGGTFTRFGTANNHLRVAKFTSTGLQMPGFTGNLNNVVNTLDTQSDGKIIIGGTFTSVNGVTRNRIARLTVTGQNDTTFNPAASTTVSKIVVQPDDKILVGGAFTTIGGATRSRFARLTATGLAEASFTGNVNNTVTAIALQSDGSILIGGSFTLVNGVTRNRIARVTSTGWLDPTFVADVNNTVNVITIDADGNILIGGAFTLVNGIIRSRFARLFPNGQLDMSFDPYPNNTINALQLDASSGSVYVGGAFTSIGGLSRSRFARIGLTSSYCAGFSGCILWLKGDAGVTLSGGSTVSAWRSQGAQDITGAMSTGAWQPKYDAITGLNYNPVLKFDGVDDGLVVWNGFYDQDTTQFVVFRTTDFTGTLTTTANTTGFAATSCGRVFNISGGTLTTLLSGNRLTSTFPINTNLPQIGTWSYGTGSPQTLAWDGIVNVTGTAWRAGVTGDISMLIGRAGVACGSGSAFNGDIAEILTFHRNLSDTEESQIESYLAIKYGVSLDQTFPRDYTLPGTTLRPWTSSLGGAYTNGIAGIGRNDASSLYQDKSRTSEYTGRIFIEKTGALADNVFLMWSNNGLSNTGWFASQLPTSDYKLMPRQWRFQETGGDMGNIGVRFETGAVTTVITSNLILFLDSDGDFSAGATPYTGTYSTSSGTWNFTINVSNGQHMAFGYYDPAPSGSLSIQAPTSLTFSTTPSPTFQTYSVTESFMLTNQRFLIHDYKGINTGYTSTLQLSGHLVNTGGIIISGSNLDFISTTIDPIYISGDVNTGVFLDYDAGHAYQSLDAIRTFVYRNDGPNMNRKGTYGIHMQLRLTIPGAKSQGSYAGTLVYTIIEN